MIKGIIAGLAFVVMIAGGYVLYAFYQKMQNSDIEVEQIAEEANQIQQKIADIPKISNLEISTEENTWTKNASRQTKNANYQLPANILDINIEVKKEEDLKTDYTKVLVKNLDDYKFFCLNEILKQKHIDYSYFKNKDSLDLLLFIPNEDKRKAILKDFEYYEIEYELSLKR